MDHIGPLDEICTDVQKYVSHASHVSHANHASHASHANHASHAASVASLAWLASAMAHFVCMSAAPAAQKYKALLIPNVGWSGVQ